VIPMKLRPSLALLGILLAVVAVGIPAAALEAGKAGAETTPSLHGTIALTGSTCICASESSQVYLFDLASGKLSQLTKGPVQHWAIGWSPDSSRLLVGEYGPGRPGLYSMRADGSSEVRLAKRWAGEASWSPDGHRVAYLAPGGYLASPTGTVHRLYVISANGTHRRLLVKRALGVGSGDFSWAPNGGRIVFVGNLCGTPSNPFCLGRNLLTVKTNGKPTIRQIGPSHHSGISQPAWSPDGSRIAALIEGRGLTVMRTDGSHAEVVPCGTAPVWSSDSSWIATYGDGMNCVAHPDGTGARSWSGSGSGITFSPNSTWLAYVGGLIHEPSGVLYVANVDASQTIQVLNDQSLSFGTPLWRGGTG